MSTDDPEFKFCWGTFCRRAIVDADGQSLSLVDVLPVLNANLEAVGGMAETSLSLGGSLELAMVFARSNVKKTEQLLTIALKGKFYVVSKAAGEQSFDAFEATAEIPPFTDYTGVILKIKQPQIVVTAVPGIHELIVGFEAIDQYEKRYNVSMPVRLMVKEKEDAISEKE